MLSNPLNSWMECYRYRGTNLETLNHVFFPVLIATPWSCLWCSFPFINPWNENLSAETFIVPHRQFLSMIHSKQTVFYPYWVIFVGTINTTIVNQSTCQSCEFYKSYVANDKESFSFFYRFNEMRAYTCGTLFRPRTSTFFKKFQIFSYGEIFTPSSHWKNIVSYLSVF